MGEAEVPVVALVQGRAAMKPQIITVKCSGPELEFPGRYDDGAPSVMTIDNSNNERTPCECYQHGLEVSASSDVLVYAHPDVTIHDPDWLSRILRLFENPNCAVAGLGGALSLGHPYLYRRSYRIQDMARAGYRSNQTDWQVHGDREQGDCRVAVLDAFLMAVRRDWLLSIGGWPVAHLSHHLLDLFLACEAASAGKETWITGASCTHHGGGTSTKPIYAEAKWLQGNSLESDHQIPHRWLYDTYRDCLPLVTR